MHVADAHSGLGLGQRNIYSAKKLNTCDPGTRGGTARLRRTAKQNPQARWAPGAPEANRH